MTQPQDPKALSPFQPYKFTPDRQRLACKVYGETASRAKAAEAANVSIRTLDRYLAKDPMFAEAMEHAKAVYVAGLEKIAIELGTIGHTQTVPGPGQTTYDKTTIYPQLLIHMLKKLDPKRHGDKQIIEHTKDRADSIPLDQLDERERALLKELLEGRLKHTEALEVSVDEPAPDE